MTSSSEWSREFDIMWNNITSNQAPGLSEYEKSVFLTRAQEDLVKDNFSDKTNILGEGFDDSARRQADFSALIETKELDPVNISGGDAVLDKRSHNHYYEYPDDVLVVLNEVVVATVDTTDSFYTVVPVSYEEYTRLMKKPYKYPAKGLAWRLITGTGSTTSGNVTTYYKRAELIARIPNDASVEYTLRYVRRPQPIRLVIEGSDLTVDGDYTQSACELPAYMHDEILYRAVQLAKISWTDGATLQGQQK